MNTATKKKTMSTRVDQFRRRAEAGIRSANPDALDLDIEWIEPARKVTWPTGVSGYIGRLQLSADGHEVRRVTARETPSGLSVG
ncbi:hypothetical protein [Arenimonas sp.]|jgi:hypothetical protein|uniref:hypothetical protein n=1 Tax=Arenimonas sp. TaxID=1872635 RepID=UPI0037BEBA93